MPIFTKTFTTDSVPGNEPIVVSTVCKVVRIREKPPAGNIPYVGGTAGYKIFGLNADGVTQNAVPATKYAGEETIFQAAEWFHVNQTIGFISALSGTMTMEQSEQW